MIVVKVEMWPGGDESRAVEFGRMEIVNDETKTLATSGVQGDYNVTIKGGSYGLVSRYKKVWKMTKVVGFDRNRFGVWHLVRKALQSCVFGG